MINWVQVIAGFFGSLGFAYVFNLRGSIPWWSSLGGALAWAVYLAAQLFAPTFLVSFALSGFFLGCFTEIMAVRTRTPRTVYIAIGIIPLIPGAGLYYTLYHFFNHDLAKSFHYAKASVGCSTSIIVGLVMSMAFWKLYRDYKSKNVKLFQ